VAERAPIEREDDRVHNVIRLTAHYLIPKFWSLHEDADTYRASLNGPIVSGFLGQLALAGRVAPIAISHPLLALHHTTIRLPFELELKPENVMVTGPSFRYDFRSAYSDKTVTYHYGLLTTRDSVDFERFADHQMALEKVQPSLERVLVYHKQVAEAVGPNWLAWVAVAVALAVSGFGARYAYPYAPPPTSADGEDAGRDRGAAERLGGWLYLVGLNLVVAPLAWLYSLRHYGWVFARRSWLAVGATESGSALRAVALAELGLGIAFIAYTLVIGTLFVKKRRTFPTHFIVYLIANFVYLVLDHALAAALHVRGSAVGAPEQASIARLLVISIMWIMYMRRSKRVARTFVNG
jgi:hypothetical protein